MKVFITGSTDGLGKLCAKSLLQDGHQVVLHARNQQRKHDVQMEISDAKVVVADFSNLKEVKRLADELNDIGRFDAIIHNAGVYRTSKEVIAKVNILAPYILTSLVDQPDRMIYVSSGLHSGGSANFDQLSDGVSYEDSKLFLLMLSMAVARKWPDVYSNTVNPGWVPTKMGGRSAPNDLQKGYETQIWLATDDSKETMVSGRYFYHKHPKKYNSLADDLRLQEQLLQTCKAITGVEFPE